MNKDILKIRKLLRIHVFHPYDKRTQKAESRRWNTGVTVKPGDYSQDQINKLVEKCGKSNIVNCLFKG